MNLNLGANDRREPGFLSVDICQPADFVWNLNQHPWPWDENSVNNIKAYDICEHLDSRIAFMNACWRVLRGGGRLHITTPNAAKGGGFFQDSTHITPWTINTFKYYCVRPDGSDTLERARFHRHFRAIETARLGFDVGPTARFRPIHIIETSYQDGVLGPNCAPPDPVYKLDVLLEAVK